VSAGAAYAGLGALYDANRPHYPAAAVAWVAAAAAPSLAVDVGCGTGIFTRLLQAALPGAEVVGIEPSADMRRTAEAASDPVITYLAGAAEALPFADGAATLVTAATAAHWFDRPRFQAEAARVLRPGGTLAILQNRRRHEACPFLSAYEALHERLVPGYRRGSYPDAQGGYAPVDFAAELRADPGFDAVTEASWPFEVAMPAERFLDFSLSSSISRRAERAIGAAAYAAEVAALLPPEGGTIPMRYECRVTLARR